MSAAAQQATESELNAIAQQMQRRYEDNLEQFATHVPQIYEQIKDIRTENTVLDISSEGLTFLSCGESVYPSDPMEYSEQQVDQFMREPSAYSIRMRYPDVHSKTVQDECIRRICQATGLDEPFPEYIFDRKNAPIFLCYGIACGFHIEMLLERLEIKHLIIYEGEVEFLIASFYCIDWRGIFEYFSVGHRRIDLFIGSNIEDHIDETVHTIRHNSLPYSSIYYMFGHLTGKFYDALVEGLKEKVVLSVQGFGFYDDEREGIEHTVGNVFKGPSYYTHPLTLKKQPPIFVIAAGPSLENDYDYIRQHQDKAVLVSCGTAIGALLKNGIQPDFHVEKERLKSVEDVLVMLERPEDLKKTHLIMTNVVVPSVAELFASCSVILKAADFPSSLFPSDFPQLNYGQPTAANFGTAVACAMEVESVYLFGVDMGMKEKDHHHAKGTVHDDIEWGPGELDTNTATIEAPGNHTETIFTNPLYQWGTHAVGRLALNSPKTTIYNFSDGAKILNTITAKHDDVVPPENTVDKQRMIREMLSCFEEKKFGPQQFSSAFSMVHQEVERVCNHAISICRCQVKSREDIIANCESIFFAVRNDSLYFPTQHLLGTVIRSPLLYIYSLAYFEEEAKPALTFAEKGFQHLEELLQFVLDDFSLVTETITAASSVTSGNGDAVNPAVPTIKAYP